MMIIIIAIMIITIITIITTIITTIIIIRLLRGHVGSKSYTAPDGVPDSCEDDLDLKSALEDCKTQLALGHVFWLKRDKAGVLSDPVAPFSGMNTEPFPYN